MKNLLLIAAVLLLISLAGNWIQYRSAELAQRDRNLEAREFRNKQKEDLAKVTARDSAISTLLNERKSDSVRHRQNQSALKSKINRLKVSFTLVAPDDSVTDGDEFILRQKISWKNGKATARYFNWPETKKDTIISLQDSLITDLENERDTVYLTDNHAIDSLQRSINELSEMFSGQLRESIRLQGQLDRERKKRFVIGPAIGIDYRGQPTISFGATYQVWRF